jgi:hypothetical protein
VTRLPKKLTPIQAIYIKLFADGHPVIGSLENQQVVSEMAEMGLVEIVDQGLPPLLEGFPKYGLIRVTVTKLGHRVVAELKAYHYKVR